MSTIIRNDKRDGGRARGWGGGKEGSDDRRYDGYSDEETRLDSNGLPMVPQEWMR